MYISSVQLTFFKNKNYSVLPIVYLYLAASPVYICILCVCVASSVDFLISDGEEESSFLTLPNSVLQRRRLTTDLSDPGLSDQQLLIQVAVPTL